MHPPLSPNPSRTSSSRPLTVNGDMSGFTLIELMIVVVLLAIFSTIAIPSFTAMIHKNRVLGAANELYDLLQYSRSEAVTRQTTILLKADGASTSGWNGDVTVTLPATTTTLRDIGSQGIQTGVTITATVGSITFTPTGTSKASTSACFKVTYTNDASIATQYVAVQGSGRVFAPSTTAPATGECT